MSLDMSIIALLLAATLLGGMVFFSFGFAPVLFAQLPMDSKRCADHTVTA